MISYVVRKTERLLRDIKFRFAKGLSFSSRACISLMLSAAFVVTPLPYYQTSEANAAGGTRTLWLHFTHTGEEKKITFRRNGKYVAQGLKELNWILRDWRRNEATKMDPRLFDLIWSVYQDSGATVPIRVVSGFRSKKTNDALRRRSRGVARTSQHTAGKAMDFFIPGVPVRKLREIGLRLQAGGVGYYPGSRTPFVHMDTGRVRHWPRMTPKQLARVFPDGKTLHTSTNGRKQRQYALALKEYNTRKTQVLQPLTLSKRQIRLAEKGTEQKKQRSSNGLLAGLFRGDKDKSKPKKQPEVVVASAATQAKKPSPKPASTDSKPTEPAVISSSTNTAEAPPIPSRIGRPVVEERKPPVPAPNTATESVIAALPPAPRPVPQNLREQFAPSQSIVVAEAPTPISRPQFETPTPTTNKTPQIVVARAGVLTEPLGSQPQIFDPTTTATLRREDFKVPTPDVIKQRQKILSDPTQLVLSTEADRSPSEPSVPGPIAAYASAVSSPDTSTQFEEKQSHNFKIERKALPAPKVLKAQTQTAAQRFASLEPQSKNPVFTLNDIGFNKTSQAQDLRDSLGPVPAPAKISQTKSNDKFDAAFKNKPTKTLSLPTEALAFSGETKNMIQALLSPVSIASAGPQALSLPLPNKSPELFVSPTRAYAGTFSLKPNRKNAYTFAGDAILVTPTVDFTRKKRTQFSWLNRR